MDDDSNYIITHNYRTIRASTTKEADEHLNALAAEGFSIVQMSAGTGACWIVLRQTLRIPRPVVAQQVSGATAPLLAG